MGKNRQKTKNIRLYKPTKYQVQQRAGCDVHKEGERNSTVPMNQPSLRPAMDKGAIVRLK